jgi:transcriptional regulator of acetoin/glycerol metabolism
MPTRESPGRTGEKIFSRSKKFSKPASLAGNVRELYHTLLRATIWSIGETLTADDIRSALLTTGRTEDQILVGPSPKALICNPYWTK